MRNNVKFTAINIVLIGLICLLLSIPASTPVAAASDHDLIIDLNLRYVSKDSGGGGCTITVQNELARDIRRNIFEEYLLNTSNNNSRITKTIADNFAEAFEDLMELNINVGNYFDETPKDAGVDYEGFYKIIKIDRVDVKSYDGLEGTNSEDQSKFTIVFDLKGPLNEDTVVTLTDAHIIL